MGDGQAAIELRGGLSVTPTLVWVMAAAIAAGVLTLATIVYARRRGLLDEPGERRSHAEATPRGGGLAIVLVVATGLAYLAGLEKSQFAAAALAGVVLVAGVGWLDDHRDLSIRLRLIAHIVAAGLLAWASGLGPLWGGLVFIAAVVLINVWNFMDGINGIAASQAAVFAGLASVLLGLALPHALAVIFLGACLGFLPFNFPKARIFMGDVGSGTLGFLVAVLLCAALMEAGGYRGVLPLLFPLAPFLVDAGWTLLARMRQRESWWTAHVTHVYQVWARIAGSHVPVTLAYLSLALAGAAIALGVQGMDINFIKISLTLWYTSLSLAWWILRKQGFARTF